MDGRFDSVWLARLAVIALLAAVMVISSDFTAAMASAGTDFLSLSGEDSWIPKTTRPVLACLVGFYAQRSPCRVDSGAGSGKYPGGSGKRT